MTVPFVPGSRVEVPEIDFQEKIQLPSRGTALVIVDMQNDFVSDGGTLVVPDARSTVPRIAELLETFRRREMPVAFTQDTHVEGDPEWQIWPEHCREGSWGWEIVEELAPGQGELVCRKSRYDGFYGTSLDHHLRQWGVKNLVIVGTVSSICVLHTAASAGIRWYNVIVPADCVSALNEFDQALSLRQISWLYTGSVTRSTDAINFERD